MVITLLAEEGSGCSRGMLPRPGTQHGASLVNASIDDLEVVVLNTPSD